MDTWWTLVLWVLAVLASLPAPGCAPATAVRGVQGNERADPARVLRVSYMDIVPVTCGVGEACG